MKTMKDEGIPSHTLGYDYSRCANIDLLFIGWKQTLQQHLYVYIYTVVQCISFPQFDAFSVGYFVMPISMECKHCVSFAMKYQQNVHSCNAKTFHIEPDAHRIQVTWMLSP